MYICKLFFKHFQPNSLTLCRYSTGYILDKYITAFLFCKILHFFDLNFLFVFVMYEFIYVGICVLCNCFFVYFISQVIVYVFSKILHSTSLSKSYVILVTDFV